MFVLIFSWPFCCGFNRRDGGGGGFTIPAMEAASAVKSIGFPVFEFKNCEVFAFELVGRGLRFTIGGSLGGREDE